jgi:hypothetical protein
MAKHTITQKDLKSITETLALSLPDRVAGISFQEIVEEFKSRDYSITYPSTLMGTLFNYWARQGQTRLLQQVAFEFAYELEEKRTSQKRMKECFQDLLNLD